MMFLFISAAHILLLSAHDVFAGRINSHYLPTGHVRTDPIINQTCLSDHVHTFYGPQALRPETTAADLLRMSPDQSTGEIRENMSLYWHPSVYKYDRSTRTYTLSPIEFGVAYYFWESDDENLVAFPPGLKMIAGVDPDSIPPGDFEIFKGCIEPHDAEGDDYTESNFFPSTACEFFEFSITFPRCWNGSLDSDDHISHVAYPLDGSFEGECPPTHQAGRFPVLSLFIQIKDYPGGWHTFSHGSDNLHADYIAGWDKDFLQSVIDDCDIEVLDNCHHMLTNSTTPVYDDEGDIDIRATLETHQPPPLDTMATISPEEVRVVKEPLPRGTCTGTLLDRDSPNPPSTPSPPPPPPPPALEPACGDNDGSDKIGICHQVSKKRCKKTCRWLGRRESRTEKYCDEQDHLNGGLVGDTCQEECDWCDDPERRRPIAADPECGGNRNTDKIGICRKLGLKRCTKTCRWLGLQEIRTEKHCDKADHLNGGLIGDTCQKECDWCD